MNIYYITPRSKNNGPYFFALVVPETGIYQLDETLTWFDPTKPGIPQVVTKGTKFTCNRVADGSGLAFGQGTACKAHKLSELAA